MEESQDTTLVNNQLVHVNHDELALLQKTIFYIIPSLPHAKLI